MSTQQEWDRMVEYVQLREAKLPKVQGPCGATWSALSPICRECVKQSDCLYQWNMNAQREEYARVQREERAKYGVF